MTAAALALLAALPDPGFAATKQEPPAHVVTITVLYSLLHPEWWGALLVIKLPALGFAICAAGTDK